MSLSDLILSIDIYGKSPVLKIGNRSSMKTYFGSAISLITFFLGFALFIYFGLQLILKQNPRIVLSVTNIGNPLPVYLSQKNFSFAIGLEDPNTFDQYIDDTIYTVTASINTGKRIKINGTSRFDWNYTNLDLVRCEVSHFPIAYQGAFSTFPLNSLYCIKNVSYILFGSFANEAFSYLNFNIYECINSTKNNFTCKPKDVIDQYLGGGFFSFYYTEISIDPLNITYPNQILVGDSYTTVSNKIYTEIDHSMKPIYITSDNGLIFEDKRTDYFLQKDKIFILNDYKPSVNFLSYTLTLSNEVDIYQRSYIKVQDVAAQIGGMLNFLTTCGFILSYFYTDIKYNQLLINQLYDFEFEKKKVITN